MPLSCAFDNQLTIKRSTPVRVFRFDGFASHHATIFRNSFMTSTAGNSFDQESNLLCNTLYGLPVLSGISMSEASAGASSDATASSLGAVILLSSLEDILYLTSTLHNFYITSTGAATCGRLRQLAATCGNLRQIAADCGNSSSLSLSSYAGYFRFVKRNLWYLPQFVNWR